jgi:N-acetylglutamate synthase-like GNAT family acetyltransferase
MTQPGQAEIVVVEHHGTIVGCWALVKIVHAECVWIDPAYRGSPTVAGRLLAGMRRVARAMGATRVVTAALTPEVERLLVKLKADALPGRHFVLPV